MRVPIVSYIIFNDKKVPFIKKIQTQHIKSIFNTKTLLPLFPLLLIHTLQTNNRPNPTKK